MSAPEEITRVVFDEGATRYWVLPDFLDEIGAAVAKIPENKRAEALVELEGDYEEWTKFRIIYDDVETDAEVAEREASQLRYEREQEQRERAQYEHLKAKFSREQSA